MNSEKENYYELLGLEKGATKEEIEFQYKEIMDFLNPANHPNKTYSRLELEEAQERMEVVRRAYNTLINKNLRKAYDESLRQETTKKVMEYERNIGVLPPINLETTPRKRRVENPPKRREYKEIEEGYVNRTPAKKKETFFQSIKRQYKEVRSDEKRYTLKMRHSRINDYFQEEFGEKVTSTPKEVLYYAGNGLTHVSLETLYQLAKLRYINKDAFTKYIIRNRRLIAVATAAGIMFSTGVIGKKNDDGIIRGREDFTTTITTPVETAPPEPVEDEVIQVPVYEPRIVLNRNYTIVEGDTLSRLAYNANSSIAELKQVNGYENEKIYYGRKMQIPYTIDTEDLTYYTESVKVNDYTLQDLAKIYETDIETLCKLNPEAIISMGNNTYYVLSDSIIVPKFITKQELGELKQKTYRYE